MLVKLNIARLKADARRRPPGYVDFVLARGKVAGEVVELDVAALNDLYEKFPEPLVSPPAPKERLKPKEAGLAKMSANFATAMAGWAKSGFKTVEQDEYDRREAICVQCEYWDATARANLGKCHICGCTKGKLWLATARCPLQPPKW